MPNLNDEIAATQRRLDVLKKLQADENEPLYLADIRPDNTPEQKAVIRRKLSKILADSGFSG